MPRLPLADERAAAVAAAAGLGALIAVQSSVNGRLAGVLGGGLRSGLEAAWWSFGSGFVVLCVLCVAVPRLRRGLGQVAQAVRDGGLRPWQLLGGLAGASLVAAQGVTVSTIGVALFTVAVVAGQTSSALAVDSAGLGPAGRVPVGVRRAAGAAVTVAAVILAVSGRIGTYPGLELALLPLIAGAATSWQQAVNGQVSRIAGAPLAAAWVNFAVGTAALGALSLVLMAISGLPTALPLDTEHWWLLTGGLYGIVVIAGLATLVRILGVLVLGLSTVAGQLVCAILLDLATTGTDHVGPTTVPAVLLAMVGVAVAAGIGGPGHPGPVRP